MEFYAKSPQKGGRAKTVQEHLQEVKTRSEEYGAAFGAEIAAGLCGLFHDFGKYSLSFQNVLNGTQTGIDHAVTGAACLYSYSHGSKQKEFAFRPIIEAIAAHHTNLISCGDLQGTLHAVLTKEGPVTTLGGKQAALCGQTAHYEALKKLRNDFPGFKLPTSKKLQPIPPFAPGTSPVGSMLYTRMLFSCLVDADYTASSDAPVEEGAPLDISTALDRLYAYCQALRTTSQANQGLNQFRNQLFERCGQAGEQEGGLFTLTAPTGTGKTLALLHFALRHCQHAGKRRIIVVLPFLSLIEQSAGIYRSILPQVMEDHSQAQLPEEFRVHAARWDQPFIVTTSVRFFESLFAHRPSDCRKLHNLANSVILFDEAQSLPISLLSPTLQAVRELCSGYGCSVVFSTATQPDYRCLEELGWSARELLPEYRQFYEALRRTCVAWEVEAPTPLEEIAERMAEGQNVCAIVNLRAHARKLYRALAERCPAEEIFLLSTDLCPAHRTQIIETIHHRQKERLPCRVVSTQCIEAGVDLDFDQLYRSLAPLEGIIQAAGRCNRNGAVDKGKVCVFLPDEEQLYPDAHYETGATIVLELVLEPQHTDIHNPDVIQRYYQKLFGRYRGDQRSRALEDAICNRDFSKVQSCYRLIDQKGVQVLVPYQGEEVLYRSVRAQALETGLTGRLLRQAAPLMVTWYDQEAVKRFCEPLCFAGADPMSKEQSPYYVVLSGQEDCYDEKLGLCLHTTQQSQALFW